MLVATSTQYNCSMVMTECVSHCLRQVRGLQSTANWGQLAMLGGQQGHPSYNLASANQQPLRGAPQGLLHHIWIGRWSPSYAFRGGEHQEEGNNKRLKPHDKSP